MYKRSRDISILPMLIFINDITISIVNKSIYFSLFMTNVLLFFPRDVQRYLTKTIVTRFILTTKLQCNGPRWLEIIPWNSFMAVICKLLGARWKKKYIFLLFFFPASSLSLFFFSFHSFSLSKLRCVNLSHRCEITI